MSSASEPMGLLMFDDTDTQTGVGQCLLAPINDLRSVCDVRTGALTTLERLIACFPGSDVALRVPERLVQTTRERHPAMRVNGVRLRSGAHVTESSVLLVNGRSPCFDTAQIESWRSMPLGSGEFDAHGTLIAARVTVERASEFAGNGALPSVRGLEGGDGRPGEGTGAAGGGGATRLLTRPWHVRSFRDACLAIDLALLTENDSAVRTKKTSTQASDQIRADSPKRCGNHAILIASTATVFPGVVIDATAGAVVVAEHATLRPGAVLCGPCYVGPHSTIMDCAVIRGGTAIGPWCKVGGEVGGTLFQGYSNKGHDGYMGDSFIGEWVNLGASTTNSNLLNTYGEIMCRPLQAPAGPGGSNERTGENFLGCILGDHVKTAICTRIMTGAIVGTGTMFAATHPLMGTLPAFRWITDSSPVSAASFGAGYRFEKFIDVARAAMARRGQSPSEAAVAALRGLWGPVIRS